MFIYNLKINGNKIFKYLFITSLLIIVTIVCIVAIRLFKGANKNSSTCIPKNSISKISPKSYTNFLKSVHENIDNYIGLKISFTGFIYHVDDLSNNQFVLARDMIISSDFKSVVVGFLCEYDKINDFENGSWIEVTGEITKGNYHGDMPIIKVISIKEIDKPNEEFVYPPDE